MGRVHEVIRRGGAVLAVCALPLLLVACGDDGGAETGASAAPATPAGFKPTGNRNFSIAVPSAWQVGPPSDGIIEIRPAGTDINRAQLRVGSTPNYKGTLDGAMKVVEGEVAVHRVGAKRSAEKEIDVPGAKGARRLEYTVPSGGGLAASKIVLIVAMSDKNTLVNVSYGINEGDPAATSLEEAVKTLQVRS